MAVTQALPRMSNGVDVDADTGTLAGIRKMRKSGNSVVLTIPREILQAAGFEPEEKVMISAQMGGDEIVIREYDESVSE